MISGWRLFLCFFVALIVGLNVVYLFFPLVAFGVALSGFVVCLVALILRPYYDRWMLERKKRRLAALRKEIVQLESEVNVH